MYKYDKYKRKSIYLYKSSAALSQILLFNFCDIVKLVRYV